MSGYKTQQLRIVRRGQSFHFVSYEGQPADLKRQQDGIPAAWYLMLSGKRWMVIPELAETTPAELDRQLGEWLDARVFSGEPAVQSQQPPPPAPGAATLAGPAEALRSAIPPAGWGTITT
jgi:hypothetical protein